MKKALLALCLAAITNTAPAQIHGEQPIAVYSADKIKDRYAEIEYDNAPFGDAYLYDGKVSFSKVGTFPIKKLFEHTTQYEINRYEFFEIRGNAPLCADNEPAAYFRIDTSLDPSSRYEDIAVKESKYPHGGISFIFYPATANPDLLRKDLLSQIKPESPEEYELRSLNGGSMLCGIEFFLERR